jgi:hypothetical protein
MNWNMECEYPLYSWQPESCYITTWILLVAHHATHHPQKWEAKRVKSNEEEYYGIYTYQQEDVYT